MTLRETMARHARVLTRADHNGELVTYQFKSGAPDRTFLAVVQRLGKQPVAPGAPQAVKNRALVFVPNDAIAGVQTHVAGDTIAMAMVLGGQVVDARIIDVITQDEGGWTFEVQG
jgi:hypothetical protein